MIDLRQLARGRPCMVRSPVCNGNPETTILAHVRLSGISGIGHKAPDVLGAHCCSACHDYCDTHHDHETKAMFAEGVYRTQNILIKEGKILW